MIFLLVWVRNKYLKGNRRNELLVYSRSVTTFTDLYKQAVVGLFTETFPEALTHANKVLSILYFSTPCKLSRLYFLHSVLLIYALMFWSGSDLINWKLTLILILYIYNGIVGILILYYNFFEIWILIPAKHPDPSP